MRLLTRDEFTNPTELKVIDVETPELGEGTGVRMRELGSGGRYRILTSMKDGQPLLRFYSAILAETLIDENGKRLCDDGDSASIEDKSVDVVKRLGKMAAELSSLEVDTDDIEDEAKN